MPRYKSVNTDKQLTIVHEPTGFVLHRINVEGFAPRTLSIAHNVQKTRMDLLNMSLAPLAVVYHVNSSTHKDNRAFSLFSSINEANAFILVHDGKLYSDMTVYTISDKTFLGGDE